MSGLPVDTIFVDLMPRRHRTAAVRSCVGSPVE